jgi:hypothetical protein
MAIVPLWWIPYLLHLCRHLGSRFLGRFLGRWTQKPWTRAPQRAASFHNMLQLREDNRRWLRTCGKRLHNAPRVGIKVGAMITSRLPGFRASTTVRTEWCSLRSSVSRLGTTPEHSRNLSSRCKPFKCLKVALTNYLALARCSTQCTATVTPC